MLIEVGFNPHPCLRGRRHRNSPALDLQAGLRVVLLLPWKVLVGTLRSPDPGVQQPWDGGRRGKGRNAGAADGSWRHQLPGPPRTLWTEGSCDRSVAGRTRVPAVPALCVVPSPLLCLPPVLRPCAWGHNGQQCLPRSRLCVTVNSGASFCEFSAQRGARGWMGLVHAEGEPSLLSAPRWWLQSGSRWLPLGFCRTTRPHVCTPHASVVLLLLAPVKFFFDVVVPSTLHQQRPRGCCPASLATPGASVLFPLV